MLRTERETVDGEKVVRVTFGHWSVACIFLCVWLAGWSFGCWHLALDIVRGNLAVDKILFALPFFAGEILVFCIILMMIFGKTVITFRRTGGTKFTGIGRIGITCRFTFPENGEIFTDEYVCRRRKGGTCTYYRISISSPSGKDSASEIYSSPDKDVIKALSQAAKEVAGIGMFQPVPKTTDDLAAEEAESERRDLAMLSAKPPKGMSVARDFEGRVFVSIHRIGWIRAIIIGLLMLGMGTVFWYKAPVPMCVFMGFCMMFPLAQVLYALFGKRKVTLDHGKGETFVGIGPLGIRRKFEYGGFATISINESKWIHNGQRMNEISIVQPGGKPRTICTTWPNDVKPYLAALLRHPSSVAVTVNLP